MIGPCKLSGCLINSTKKKLRLTINRPLVADTGYRSLWRNKMGCNLVRRTGFMVSSGEIQFTFPEKLTGGCIIGSERKG